MRCHGNHSPPLAVLTDLGVLVAVRGTPGSSSLGKNAAFFSRVDGGTTFSASGTLVSAQVALPNDDCGVDQVSLSVVTSSSLIWPFIRRANKSLGKLTELQDGDLLPGTSIRVLMAGGSTPIWRHASLQGIYEVHGALQIAAGMACGQVPLANCGLGWKFGWRNSVDSLEDTSIDSKPPLPSQGDFLPLSGVCHIAVLRISTNNSNLPHQAGQQLPWSLLHSRTARLLTQGEWLALSGSPYGALAPQLFLNTISVGVVSNLLSLADEVHPHPALVSVDARFMPGQEGGPVVDGNGNFIGIMTLPMRLSAEGTELPLMLSACSVRETLLATCSIYPGMQTRSKIKLQSPPAIYNHDLSSQWLASVVMIETEVGWGTGLVISACGTVITNAHVIAEATKIRVKIHHLGSQQWHAAAKIHAFEGPLDIAVLAVDLDAEQCLRAIPLCMLEPEKGQNVLAVGYGMLGPKPHAQDNWAPSVSRGNISQVIWSNSSAVMVLSSATVHAGASGGALINEETWTVAGLITSNSHTSNGAVLPHLNYSLPACLLRDIWDLATDAKSMMTAANLRALDTQTTTHVNQNVWGLRSSM